MKKLLLKSEKSILLIFLLIVTSITRGQSTQTYPSTGSFVTPAGVTTVKVEAYSGGGGGGRGGSSSKNGGGGGGGGAYTVNNAMAVVPGTSYSLTIGTGGSGSTGGNGGNGTTTTATFASSTITATGGAGGRSYANGGNGGSGGSGTRNGGTGGTGLSTGSGGGGGAAGISSGGGNGGVPTAGTSGGVGAGAGGAGSLSNISTGTAGSTYGGGGGGGTQTSNGGNGASGYMIITYTCPTYDLTTITATGPFCGTSASVVTLTSSVTSLPAGTYTVTYNLSGATTATGNTTTMTVAAGSPGTGTFTTPTLNVGTTTITVTNLTSSYCSSAITSNNTVTVGIYNTPTVNAGTAINTCATSGAVNITAGASSANATGGAWSSSGSGSFVNINSIVACTYTPSAADIAAGSVTITLTVYNPGCSVSSNKTLTISKPMTAVAGTNIDTCIGAGAVNITAGSSATEQTSLAWTSSGTGTFANSNSLTTCTYNPSAADITAGSVTLTLTVYNAGCPNVTSTKTLTINGTATSVAGTAVNACVIGGPVNITAGSSATNYSSVAWTSNGTGTFTNANSLTLCTYNPSALDIAAGSVTLTLTAYGISPCVNATSTKTLTIRSIVYALVGTPVTTCAGAGAVNITSGSSATNQTIITWTSSGSGTFVNPNSLTTCTYNPSAADITAGGVTLTLTASNGGCADVVLTKSFTINPTLVASINISASTTSSCAGNNVTFTATPTNGGSTPSYQWKLNGSNVGTNSPTYSSTTLTSGNTVTCILTSNATPCLTGSPATSNTITMTVNPNLTPSVIISTATTSVCAGATTVFTATPTNGGSSPSYQWKVNGTNVGTNSATYSTTTLANSNVVSCVMTSNATPCLVSPTATSNSLTMTVNPYAIASVSINTAATTICSGTNVTFTATPTNGGTTPTYQWTLNGTNVGTNSTTYSSSTLTSGDQIVCIMTSNISTCLLGSPATSNTVTMTVNTTPSVTGTTPGSRSGTGTVVLAATGSTGSTLYWYTALSGGTSIASGTSFTTPSISATTTYYVEAAAPSGCTSTPRIAVAATIYAPEMDVQGNLVSIADNDSTPAVADWTDFNGASSRTFTIYNTGTGILNIGAISFSGINASEFSITVAPSGSVAAGDNTSFTVQFTPTAAGTRTAAISIINDDSNENPYNFSLQGTGTAQEINLQGNSTNIVNGDTTPTTADWTDFSNVTTTRTFTIQNTGSITLTIGAITFTGGNSGDFSILTAPSATVAGRSQTTFTVKFTAGATGLRSTTINIVNNDSSENPYTFKIQGNTTSINMNVKAGTVLIPDGKTTTSTTDWTDFGSTNISAPITRTFTVENTGTNALNLTGTPKVSLTGSTDFSVTTQPSSPVAASSTTTYIITFTPTSTGAKNATVSIANNDAGTGKNPYTYNITGNGIQAFTDTDGDGVYNNLDSDDDNDGIPDNIEQSYAAGSVLGTQVTMTLLNETFGVGTTRGRIYDNVPSATTTYCWEDGTTAQAADECDTSADLNDGEYTISNTAQITSWAASIWYTGVDHTPSDTNGKMGLFNATNNITEEFYRTTLQGVITNAPLTYSFWILNLDRSDAANIDTRNRPNITVEFRDLSNNLISSINTGDIAPTTAGNAAGNWFQFSATFNPTTTGFTVVFRNNQLGGLGNDLALDDILITQKLTDSDQDGIADAYDLDSDNDGIGDIIEDGWTTQANGKDTMDLTAATWIDANHNGQLDASETAYAGVGYPKNSDTDLVPNYIDLDSDNDSIFDVDEMGLLNGDGDINGDGEGEGTDVDKDGILSLFDTLSGFGNSGKALPTNTLGTGNYDYMKVISKTAGVYDISTTLYASLDANNDGKIDGSADVDRDGILDGFDTNVTFYGSPRDLDRKLLLDFDGRNDYAEDSAILGGLPNASIMAWVDINSAISGIGFIVGQDKFHIRVTGSKILQVVTNGTITSAPTALNTSQWYHVAATYANGAVTLYLNGKSVATASLTGSIAADASKLSLGRNPVSGTLYFKGKIDEVRVFNVALTDSQVQRMVYQEIQNSSSQVRGTIVPRDVGSLPFTNLLRYYRMDAYKNDIIDNWTTTSIDTGTGMKMYNHKNIYVQQAPMPFITERTGTFATAVNSPTNDIRGLDIMDQDWSIVQVKHTITETANNTDLGMFVDAGVTVNMTNDTKIQNDWYLKLDGKIDLVGKSQLIQTTTSNLDPNSIGSLERDQQGQSNKFNYNYWSSPVSSINTTTINHGFTVAGVMKDGTNVSTPQSLLWTTGINASATSPITLSSYWIFKFQNSTNTYANWASVGQNGTLLPGQGYTLKGSGAATATQNYTFVGKPNSGTITSVVGPTNLNLCGNPYPSAIDADQFIDDNLASIKGTLYIWEHYSSNASHNTIAYQGGYATYTKTGGTAPVAPAGISGLGSSSKTPKRFIPVGQGFFVTGSATGGTITFNNGQRMFFKEDDATNSYTMFKTNTTVAANSDPSMNNSEDTLVEEQFTKLRLGYNSSDNYHRQILLGFMNQHATAGYDNGYDAVSIETLTNDMYFINGADKLNISGDGYFNVNNIYPLGVKNATAGNVTFVVDGKENFSENQEIYIYDNVTSTYNSIKSQNYTVNLPAGTYDTRFSLTFKNGTALGTTHNEENHGIAVTHSQANNMINIKNAVQEVTVKSVLLFNLLGQKVADWKIDNQNQADIQLQVSDLSTGTYIVKVLTDGGDITKKILVKN